jgi:hypothetical protein
MRRRTIASVVALGILVNLLTAYARVALLAYFLATVGTGRSLPGDPVARWVRERFLTRPSPNPVYPAPRPGAPAR